MKRVLCYWVRIHCFFDPYIDKLIYCTRIEGEVSDTSKRESNSDSKISYQSSWAWLTRYRIFSPWDTWRRAHGESSNALSYEILDTTISLRLSFDTWFDGYHFKCNQRFFMNECLVGIYKCSDAITPTKFSVFLLFLISHQ